MIWATWRMHRSLFLTSIAVAIAFAIWLVITGEMEAHAWTTFISHHCSVMSPGSSTACMNSYHSVGDFSTVNAALCGALPALLGLVLGVPLVAGEIQARTNRLAWTQSITRTRWVLVKLGVGAVFTAGLVGAMAPLFWWWTDAAQRNSHIQPANFDISGFAPSRTPCSPSCSERRLAHLCTGAVGPSPLRSQSSLLFAPASSSTSDRASFLRAR